MKPFDPHDIDDLLRTIQEEAGFESAIEFTAFVMANYASMYMTRKRGMKFLFKTPDCDDNCLHDIPLTPAEFEKTKQQRRRHKFDPSNN